MVKIANNMFNMKGMKEMKKNIFIAIIICLSIIFLAIFTANKMIEKQKTSKQEEKVEAKVSEEILDDCTDEYEQIEGTNTIKVNSEQEKISPYCSFTIKTYYKDCGHVKKENLELPQELVNCTEDEIKSKYNKYTVEKYASNELVLYQQKDGECGEHFLVKDTDGKVTIYVIDENGEERLYETTEIAVDYLTQTDKANMVNGIKVIGKQELNQLIEDFE